MVARYARMRSPRRSPFSTQNVSAHSRDPLGRTEMNAYPRCKLTAA
jgi:hypothetical protein